jgi:protein-S-isoprenylcysteine O-methyltransferase Ste14
MELYGTNARSWPQKVWILACELGLLVISYRILFGSWGLAFQRWIGWVNDDGSDRRVIIFAFSLIVFARMTYMMLRLLRRRIPLEEAISIPLAFSVYYVGFALFTLRTQQPLGIAAAIGVVLFVAGSLLNTLSEIQRDRWKRRPENRGRLFTRGLFAWSMHINYCGDLLWVTGYALVSDNLWAGFVPIGLFCFFAFYNVPKLDEYLEARYGVVFKRYRERTARLIPFIY